MREKEREEEIEREGGGREMRERDRGRKKRVEMPKAATNGRKVSHGKSLQDPPKAARVMQTSTIKKGMA